MLHLRFFIFSFCFLLSPVLFSQSLEDSSSTEAFDLALRMSLRSRLTAELNCEKKCNLDNPSEASLSSYLEKLTQEFVQNAEPRLSKKEEFKKLWKELRKMGYWDLLSRFVTKTKTLSSNFKEEFVFNSKLKGLGFSAVYSSFKIAGAILGLAVFAAQRYDVLLVLNSFSWNTTAASLLTFPARVMRYIYLRVLSRFRKSFSSELAQVYKNTVFKIDSNTFVPAVFLEEPGARLHFFLRLLGFGKSKAMYLQKDLQLYLKSRNLPDFDFERSLMSRSLSRPLKMLLLWKSIRAMVPGFAARTAIRDKSLDTREIALSVDPALLSWATEMLNAKSQEDVYRLIALMPNELSDFQKVDLIFHIVLPYVARAKPTLLGFFAFRRILKRTEEFLYFLRGMGVSNVKGLSLNEHVFGSAFEGSLSGCKGALTP